MRDFLVVFLALICFVFLSIWLGFPASEWRGDTTVFGVLAVVSFVGMLSGLKK